MVVADDHNLVSGKWRLFVSGKTAMDLWLAPRYPFAHEKR
jgi:hypothetical protein